MNDVKIVNRPTSRITLLAMAVLVVVAGCARIDTRPIRLDDGRVVECVIRQNMFGTDRDIWCAEPQVQTDE